MTKTMKPFEERVVWSPEHGGCLMIQRRYDGTTSVGHAVGAGWVDWTSGCEGEYPTLASAQRAVADANDRLARLGTLAEVA